MVSLLMELGVPPHVVQAIARHADVKITLKIYSHANQVATNAKIASAGQWNPTREVGDG